jgi:hypothetical protein
MAKKRKPVVLPEPGAAFAFQLDDGRYGACRVLRTTNAKETKEYGEPCVLVAASSWVGDELPDPANPALRKILKLTHHSWKNQLEILWVSDLLPQDFQPIGIIPPSKAETKQECHSYGGWESLRLQPLLQWRWDHEREKVLAEDEEEEKERLRQIEAKNREHKKYLASLTLEGLSQHRFFKTWDEFPSKEAIRRSRLIMRRTQKRLLKIGKQAPKANRMAILKECIEAFNALDEELDTFIYTIEREDIREEFYLLANACGLGKYTELADEWREW